jgi:anti-sigma B factor antagonist
MGLQVSLREAGEVTIIDLAGDLVFPDCAELHLEVKKLLQAGTRRVALNLEKVEGVDQHGLGTLSACFVSVLREFATLSLLNPSQEVRDALKKIRLEKVVTVYDSEEDLLRNLEQDQRQQEGFSLLDQLRQVVCAALWAFMALVLIVLWMQLSHPAALDRMAALVELEALVLDPLGELSGDPASVLFYLIFLVFLASALLIYLDSHLHWLRRRLHLSQ